jgi:hypothetical protein
MRNASARATVRGGAKIGASVHNLRSIQSKFAALSVAVWLCSAVLGQIQTSITRFRLTAGDHASLVQDSSARLVSIQSVRTEPPLDFPIRVVLSDDQQTELRIVVPPATRPGTYRVAITGSDQTGQERSMSIDLTVNAVTITKSPTGRTPVILLNGFQVICFNSESTIAASQDTFGQMAALLQADQVPVTFFNNCTYGDISIEQLAQQLSVYIGGLT